jgi:LacI family transcriptional regulator
VGRAATQIIGPRLRYLFIDGLFPAGPLIAVVYQLARRSPRPANEAISLYGAPSLTLQYGKSIMPLEGMHFPATLASSAPFHHHVKVNATYAGTNRSSTTEPMQKKSNPRPISIRDVAALAGVSLGTTSRVINNVENVTVETREKVVRAIAALGYRPNHAAQSLRLRTSRTIGCMVTDVTNPLYAKLYRAVEERFRKDGYMLLLANSLNNMERELEILAMFEDRGMDGVLGAPGNERNRKVLAAVENMKIPVVVMDRDMVTSKDKILFEHVSGLKSAVSYLIELGHRDIALVLAQTNNRPMRRRIEGFKAGFKAHHLPVPDDLIVQLPTSMSSAYAAVSELLRMKKRPTAIISQGTAILNETLNAISAAGLRLPDDLSLLSIGDPEFAATYVPAISTLRTNLHAVAEESARLLLCRIRGEEQPEAQVIRVATDLILRKSCGQAPALTGR